MVKRKQLVFSTYKSMKQALEALPTTTTATLITSVTSSHTDPTRLARALAHRLTQPKEGLTERISVSVTGEIAELVLQMSQMTRLSSEEVLRLAIEAYLYHL